MYPLIRRMQPPLRHTYTPVRHLPIRVLPRHLRVWIHAGDFEGKLGVCNRRLPNVMDVYAV